MLKRKNDIKKPLKEYYSNYYNHQFFRDFRYIFDGLQLENNKKLCFDGEIRYNHVFNANKISSKSNPELRANHFLTRKDHDGHLGLLGGEITFFKSYDEYNSGQIYQRWNDRQFYDLDIESDKVEAIKNKIKKDLNEYLHQEISKRTLMKKISEHKSEFRNLIFNEDLLYPTFQEAKRLCLFLEDMGLKPYLIFSGLKGFHCNLFYEEARILNLSQVSRLFAKTFSDKLDLKSLDYAVFDRKKAQRRLQRCQYFSHSKTDLTTVPIPNIYDYDEFMSILKAKNTKPIEFDFHEYSSKSSQFRESLMYNDKQFTMINERELREKRKENEERRKRLQKKYKGKYKNYQDISMVDLYSDYGGEIIKEDSQKAIVRCLFHGADRNPSAVIFKNSNYFYCSSCGKTLNYYGMISEMEGTDDHHEIMSKADEYLK